MSRLGKKVLIAAAVVVVAVVGGPWVYINVIRDDAPDRLTLSTTTLAGEPGSATTVAPGVEGAWDVTTGSEVGYRVKEILFGQSTEGVGRTSEVSGSLTIEGARLVAAEFTVEMATLESDDSRRDGKFRGEIMDTSTYPTATFTLSDPIEIPASALTGEAFSTEATGSLSLRGTTKNVTVTLEARLSGGSIEVAGSINIVFAEWGIPNPSNPAITTEDNGDLEFRLVFTRR